MNKGYIVLFLMLFSSCENFGQTNIFRRIDVPIDLVFGCDLSDGDRAAITVPASVWESTADRILFNLLPCIERGKSTDKFGIFISKRTDGETWATTYETHMEFNDPWRAASFNLKTSVAIHEFGHMLGLGHVDEFDCSMYMFVNEYDTVSDIKKLCPAEEEFARNLGR